MTFQTFTPKEYLAIDIANNFGLDKKKWDERLAWFNENEDKLEDLFTEAKDGALFFAGVSAYRRAQKGLATGYTISLDATASGAQIYSVLIGCQPSAMSCNVLDTGNRENLYQRVWDGMVSRFGIASAVDMDKVKSAVMTSLYGSQNEPRKCFQREGQDIYNEAGQTLLNAFYDTMEEELPGIWHLNTAMLENWDPEALSYDWVMPDNFHVHTKVMDFEPFEIKAFGQKIEGNIKINRPTPTGRSLGANMAHSVDGMIVREMGRRCSYSLDAQLRVLDALTKPSAERFNDREQDLLLKRLWSRYEKTGFLSARVLDLIDAHNVHLIQAEPVGELLLSLPNKPFPVIAIHDCFRCHPNYGNDLRRQYNRILYEISRSTMLQDLLEQITGNSVQVVKYADISEEILHANYALS